MRHLISYSIPPPPSSEVYTHVGEETAGVSPVVIIVTYVCQSDVTPQFRIEVVELQSAAYAQASVETLEGIVRERVVT